MTDKTRNSRYAAALRRQLCGRLFLQEHFRQLLGAIENVSIFVKSADGRLVFGNRSLIRRLGLQDETELLGRTDLELLPSHLVEKYRQDDLEVLRSGRPRLNLVELFRNEQGLLKWFITHKYPVLDRDGHAIGVMGCIQEYWKMNPAISSGDPGILVAANYIQKHYRNPVSVEGLSRLSGMPLRQFERKFKRMFDVSPREYIIRHRLRYACEGLRNTRKSIARLCVEAGFYDQSSFTLQFKKYMSVTPLKYRKGALRDAQATTVSASRSSKRAARPAS